MIRNNNEYAVPGRRQYPGRREMIDITEIMLTYPNVTLEYAEYCKDGMTRVGIYDEVLNGKLGYMLKVGDEAGFLHSEYIGKYGSGHFKYPLMTSTVVKEITAEGVWLEDKYKNDPLTVRTEPDTFVPFADLRLTPVDKTRIKFCVKDLLRGNIPTQEFDVKKGKYIDLPVFSEHWPRSVRLDSNLKNFRLIEPQLSLFDEEKF